MPRIDRVEQRDADVVDEAQGAERLRQLEAAGEPEPRALMRDEPVEVAAVERDAAGLVAQGAAQAIDQCRFARPVRPDQTEPVPGVHRQVDVFERDKAAKPLAEPVDVEELGHHEGVRMLSAPRRHRSRTTPTSPFGAMITKAISSNPTINRLAAEEIVTVASCWIVP